MTDDEMERLADLVVHKMLEAPSGAVIRLHGVGSRSPHMTLLPDVPQTGEIVWHSPRSNSAPQPFVVRRVEWWDGLPERQADVFVQSLEEGSELAKEVWDLPPQRSTVKRKGQRQRESVWSR